MLRKLLLVFAGIVVVLGVGGYAAFKLSPWPSVWLIRYTFARGGERSAASAAPFVPPGMVAERGLSYAPGDPDALFDRFAPPDAPGPLPAVVWVHGGGFVAGSRSDLSNYLQVLAARGFVAFAVDYSRAPGARYPTPVRQANAALAHIAANAARFNIDPDRIFLAGDSAGAQIAAQTALIISDPAYARRIGIAPGLAREALRGTVLFCGVYDSSLLDFEGDSGWFLRTVVWSYLGTRDAQDPRIAQISLVPHVTAAFPPTFISAGNADPLEPHSRSLARALRARGVEVDSLFFPAGHQPPLDHEYQLLLSTEAGRRAFERSVAFLAAHAR